MDGLGSGLAGSAVAAFNSVYGAVFQSGDVADDGLYIGGGHVLSPPAEGVACAILEEQVAQFVHFQNVAGEEGGVSASEHVARDLLLAYSGQAAWTRECVEFNNR